MKGGCYEADRSRTATGPPVRSTRGPEGAQVVSWELRLRCRGDSRGCRVGVRSRVRAVVTKSVQPADLRVTPVGVVIVAGSGQAVDNETVQIQYGVTPAAIVASTILPRVYPRNE